MNQLLLSPIRIVSIENEIDLNDLIKAQRVFEKERLKNLIWLSKYDPIFKHAIKTIKIKGKNFYSRLILQTKKSILRVSQEGLKSITGDKRFLIEPDQL